VRLNGTRRLHRGDVVRVRFDPVEGSEQGGERPALIISPEIINRGTMIVVAAITSKRADDIYPWECLIEAGEGGLTLRSKVMFRHLRGVSKSRITGYYGAVLPETLQQADEALKVVVGLINV
jgi:mRNA interferase MazF